MTVCALELRGVALEYMHWMLSVSVVLTVLSLGALVLRQYAAAAIGFLALGVGAIAIVWDGWSARTGYHMEFVALLHPVSLSSRDAFLLVTHAPFLLAGIVLIVLNTRRSGESTSSEDLAL